MTFTNKKRKNSSTKAKLTNCFLEKRFGKVVVPGSLLIITLICVHYKSADAVFIERPKNTTVIVNHSTFFDCSKFSNTSKEPTWYHHPLDGARREVYDYKKIIDKYKDRFSIDKDITSGTFNLLVLRPEKTDAGRYECVVEDDEENEPGASAELTVLDSNLVCESDKDLNEIVGPTECAKTIAPDQLQLSCSVSYSGNFPPQLEWRKVGSEFLSNETECVVRNNRVMCNATLEANLNIDGSVYICQIITAEQYNCSLKVNDIIYAFANTTKREIQIGDEVTCVANASRQLPCSYQWHKENTTEVYSHPTIKPTDPGLYRCQAQCLIRNDSCTLTAMAISVPVPGQNCPHCQLLLVLLVIPIIIGVILAIKYRGSLLKWLPHRPHEAELKNSTIVKEFSPEPAEIERAHNRPTVHTEMQPLAVDVAHVPESDKVDVTQVPESDAPASVQDAFESQCESPSPQGESSADSTSVPTITDHSVVETLTINEYFIDRGASGAIYGPFRWKDKKCAIKQILYSPDKLTDKRKKEITKMRDRCKELNHPHLVKVFDVWFPSPALYIVMEYAEGRSLDKVLRPKDVLPPLPPVELKFVKDWALQIADGMWYLHEQKLVHRNLKGAHVLVMESPDALPNTLKIGSYTLTADHDHSTVMSLKGTMAWMAPECISRDKFSMLSDVWSYGVTVWEILSRDVPFREVKKETELMRAAMNKTLKLEIPESCPAPLQDLLRDCLNHEVGERPSFKDICSKIKSMVL